MSSQAIFHLQSALRMSEQIKIAASKTDDKEKLKQAVKILKNELALVVDSLKSIH